MATRSSSISWPSTDHGCQPFGQVMGGFRQIARIHARGIKPAPIEIRNPAEICAKKLCNAFDLIGHGAGILDGHLFRGNGRVSLNGGLKPFAQALGGAPVSNDIRDQPGGVAQRKIALAETVPASRNGFHPVGGKKPIGLRGAHRVVPERACEYVISLRERFKRVGNVNTCRAVCFALCRRVPGPAHIQTVVRALSKSNGSASGVFVMCNAPGKRATLLKPSF